MSFGLFEIKKKSVRKIFASWKRKKRNALSFVIYRHEEEGAIEWFRKPIDTLHLNVMKQAATKLNSISEI